MFDELTNDGMIFRDSRGQKRGEDSPYWKGEQTTYGAKHIWIRKWYAKESKCNKCNKATLKTEWSNISGDYLRDRSDWQELCIPCHRTIDFRKSHCRKGHEMTEENSYWRPDKTNTRACKQCVRDAKKRYRLRKGAAI